MLPSLTVQSITLPITVEQVLAALATDGSQVSNVSYSGMRTFGYTKSTISIQNSASVSEWAVWFVIGK
jgi:uncharacterized protein YpbB